MNFEADIIKSLDVLNRGGLILYPTDTIWGIGCDATDPEAVEKVFDLKRRPGDKSLIILLAEERDVLKYVTQPDLQVFDFLESREKPTTVIYEGAIGLASNLLHENLSVAIRIVRDPFCRALIKRFRKPLVSTSANVSGLPAPGNFDEVSEEIRSGVDYIVNHRQDDRSIAAPSSIVRWEKNGQPTFIRP